MYHDPLADEVESLAAARKAALSGSEPSDSIRVCINCFAIILSVFCNTIVCVTFLIVIFKFV